jgi:modified peptide precursor CbpA
MSGGRLAHRRKSPEVRRPVTSLAINPKAKDFGKAQEALYQNPFLFIKKGGSMKKEQKAVKNGVRENKPAVIASRKSCAADGTGLSHYILVDKKSK